MFHIPPRLKWDARAVQQALQSHGLNSRVEGQNVVIVVHRSGIFRHLRRFIDFYVPSFRLTLTIEYCRDSVIDVVKVHCHPGVPIDRAIRHIESVMRNFGYLQIGTDATVREIATSMNSSVELNKTLDEFDFHQTKYRQDDLNHWARERDVIIARIEKLVLNVATR